MCFVQVVNVNLFLFPFAELAEQFKIHNLYKRCKSTKNHGFVSYFVSCSTGFNLSKNASVFHLWSCGVRKIKCDFGKTIAKLWLVLAGLSHFSNLYLSSFLLYFTVFNFFVLPIQRRFSFRVLIFCRLNCFLQSSNPIFRGWYIHIFFHVFFK